MIRVTDTQVHIEGDFPSIIADAAKLIDAVHKFIKSKYDEQTANEMVALIGRIALAEKTSEVAQEMAEKFDAILDDAEERMEAVNEHI